MTPKFDLYPFFSSPLVAFDLSSPPLEISNHIDKFDDGRINYESANINCLDEYPEDKERLLNKFYEYTTEVLGLEDQKFKISTSWITKTNKNNIPNGFHSHKNSFYSGVYYFNDGEGFAPLILDNVQFDRHHFFITKKDPTKGDIVISNLAHFLPPKKNILLLFPSYISHAIGQHNSEETRYSMAFNIVPEGTIGLYDSTVTIN